MKASSTGVMAGRAGREDGVTATGVALLLISRVVEKMMTPTRPRTTRPRIIALGLIRRCSRPLARDIIVAAAGRPTAMAASTGRSLGGGSMSRRILRLTGSGQRPTLPAL